MRVCVHSFLAKGQGKGFSDRQAEIRVFPQRQVALLKFQANKGTVSGHALQPYFIGKCGVTITFRAFSDRLRDFRGAQRGSRVLRLLRFVFGKRRRFREKILRAYAVAATKEKREMIAAPNAPTGAAAFHAVSNDGKNIAFHTSQPGVMYDARLTGRRDFNAPFIVSRQRVFVCRIVSEQFRETFFFLFVRCFVARRFQTFQQSGNFSGV